jgi:hypothetical protein
MGHIRVLLVDNKDEDMIVIPVNGKRVVIVIGRLRGYVKKSGSIDNLNT